MSDTLTFDEIDILLGEAKTRGEYKPVLKNFFESGDLYLNLSARFHGKKASSLRNAVNIRLEKDFANNGSPAYKLMVVGKPVEDGGEGQAVMLVNMDTHAAQKAAAANTNAGDSTEVED